MLSLSTIEIVNVNKNNDDVQPETSPHMYRGPYVGGMKYGKGGSTSTPADHNRQWLITTY